MANKKSKVKSQGQNMNERCVAVGRNIKNASDEMYFHFAGSDIFLN